MGRLPILLAALGVITLILGAALIGNNASSAMSHMNQPLRNAEYVGSNTCFTCHKDQPPKWEGALQPIIIQDAVSSPAVVRAGFSTSEQSRAVEIGGDSRPFTLEDLAYAMNDEYHQRYIMKTDNGYKALPRRWGDWLWLNALSS